MASARADRAVRDTAHTAADSTGDATRPLTAGLAVGGIAYYGGRTEQAATATVRFAPRSWAALAVAPSALTAREPRAAGGSQRFTGLADLPVTLDLGRALPLPGAPSLGATYTLVVPVGDTARGFGGGRLGASVGATVGLSPIPRVSLSLGGGRALAGLSPRTAFDATTAAWGDAGLAVDLGRGLEVSAGYGRDLGPVDTTYGRSQTVSGGLALRLPGVQMLNVAAAHGLAGAAPRWSVSVGVGLATSSLEAIARGHSPVEALVGALGAGPHGLPSATRPGRAAGAPGHDGSGPGAVSGAAGTSGGRGRGHHP